MLCEIIGLNFFNSPKSGRDFCTLCLAYDDVRVTGRNVTSVMLQDEEALHDLRVGDLVTIIFDQRGRCIGWRKEN